VIRASEQIGRVVSADHLDQTIHAARASEARSADQSGFALENLTTLPHFRGGGTARSADISINVQDLSVHDAAALAAGLTRSQFLGRLRELDERLHFTAAPHERTRVCPPVLDFAERMQTAGRIKLDAMHSEC
jgi:hypothetical protein